jgi:uncharacterized membrane protein YdbT with pleckstrin-like domain
MGYPKRLLTEGEEIIREFRPHWRLLVIPAGWTVLFAAAIIASWVYITGDGMGWDIIRWVITGAGVVAFFVLGLYPFIQWWFTWYVLTNERLITRKGVLARKGKEIPLESINDVTFNQNILERILRSGDLLVESAGEQGQSRFSDIPDPEAFQSLLYRIREERSRDLSGSQGYRPGEGEDATFKLERLARLLQDGMISQEEYDAKKQALLDEI